MKTNKEIAEQVTAASALIAQTLEEHKIDYFIGLTGLVSLLGHELRGRQPKKASDRHIVTLTVLDTLVEELVTLIIEREERKDGTCQTP